MDYEQSFTSIINVFGETFLKAYKNNKMKGKTKILKFIVSFYRRWYHSAIIEDTLISPANLITELNRLQGKPLCTYPIISLNSYDRISIPEVMQRVYTIDTHPVIKDLEIFIESCYPDVELKENGIPTADHVDTLLDKVSVYDPFYVEYLGMLAVKLKLLKKSVSIYSNKAQVSEKYKKLFAKKPNEIFKAIVEASAEISSFFINQVLPLDKKYFNKEYIIKKLKEPTTTDEIFKEIYESIGLSFESIVDMDPQDNADEFYGLIMSSTFFLGIVIDKYFYTLFGFYLKIISPEYMLPYDIADDLTYAIESFKIDDEVEVSMFAPCYNYYLTELGNDFFQIQSKNKSVLNLRDDTSLDLIFKLATTKLVSQSHLEKQLDLILDKVSESKPDLKIWELKIAFNEQKNLWIKIDVTDNFTLHDLYNEICYEFNLPIANNYIFYKDTTESPFVRFMPSKSGKRSSKSDETKLSTLEFEENHEFVLVLENTHNPFDKKAIPLKQLKFHITLRKIKNINNQYSYPRVIGESKALKEMYNEFKFPF